MNKRLWREIREEVREWCLDGWETWEEEEPWWFNDAWKARVDEDMIPGDSLDRLKGEGGKRRRSSIGDLFRGAGKEEGGGGGRRVVPVAQ